MEGLRIREVSGEEMGERAGKGKREMDFQQDNEGLLSREPEDSQFVDPETMTISGSLVTSGGFTAGAAPSPSQSRFCPARGAGVMAQTVLYPKCPLPACGPAKDKTVAVLLAVFLTFWTWLYTYQQSKVKFWVGLGLSFLGIILTAVFVGLFILFGVWLWAVIDAVSKPQYWYSGYRTARRADSSTGEF